MNNQTIDLPSEPKPLAVATRPLSSDSFLAVIDRAARDNTVDVAKMERLMAMAEKMHDRQAEAEYDQAMNAAQAEMRPISRDCHNPQTRSKYASYEAIDRAIRPVYSAHGFALCYGSRASSQPDHVIVTCRVSHRAGHKEAYEVDMPADGKGLKGGDMMTKTHATGSALSYGQRYLAKLIFNLSFGGADDDGNAAGQTRPAPPGRVASPSPPQRAAPPAKPAPAPTQAPPPRPVASDAPANEATRTRTLQILKAEKDGENRQIVLEYLQKANILLPNEEPEEWPLRWVPNSKEQLESLQSCLDDFASGGDLTLPYKPNDDLGRAGASGSLSSGSRPSAAPGPPTPSGNGPAEAATSTGPDAPDAPWRSYPVPFGQHSGTKLADLDKNVLFGFWANYQPQETWQNAKGITLQTKPEKLAKDREFRAMLDAAGQHYEFRHPETTP